MSTRQFAPEVAEHIAKEAPHHQEVIRALMDAIFQTDPGIEEAIKWNRITFTVGGNWHHWLCGIDVTKRGVTLMFHKGVLLNDPSGVLQGTGRYLRQIKPDSVTDINKDAVIALVRHAIDKQTDMLDSDA